MASKAMASSGSAQSPPEEESAAAVPTAEPSTHSRHLDRLIHERLRLGIVSALAVNDSLSFSELKKLLTATDGNLSVHARKLEDAGYISCRKYFKGRLPRTEYSLLRAGREAFERYLDHMDSLIRAARRGANPA